MSLLVSLVFRKVIFMSIESQIALLNQRIQKLSSNGKNVENVGVLRSLVRERRNLLRKLS